MKTKGPQDEERILYFFLAGLEDHEVKDKDLMKKIAKYTKLNTNERVKNTNKFLKLLNDEKKIEKNDDNKNKEILSPKEKSEKYGIEVFPVKESFKAYIMKEPTLIGAKNQKININDRVFPVLEKVNMINWICLYEKNNYYEADNLYKTLNKASKGFGKKINEPEWIEMPNKANHIDWTTTVDDYIGKGKSKYSFALFLLGNDKNEKFYSYLKKHSLCKNGYVSQVVKTKSIQKKGAMSVCSKILLQINAKLRGSSYQFINKYPKNIMVVGVDSSHFKKKGRGIAMVATINNNYTDFYNKEDIIKEDDDLNIGRLQLCVRSFIEEVIEAYKKNNNQNKPEKIIIYRQGVSFQQKEFLKIEIGQIDEGCKNNNIKYYYILVNTKTTFKFFEMDENEYEEEYEEKERNL